jgi:hypothetical protein
MLARFIFKRLQSLGAAILIFITVVVLYPVLPPEPREAKAATRLGLHVTQEELNCWRQRAGLDPQGANGITCPVKYKTVGDVRANSPGDWTKIENNAKSTLSNGRFTGNTTTSCTTTGTSMQDAVGRGNQARDAAFYYLVTGDLNIRANVINELTAQIAEAGTDFSNSTRWCVVPANGDNWFRPALWLAKMIYTYDYLLAGDQMWGQTLASGTRNSIETWILNGANYFEAVNHATISLYVQNRKSDATFTANYTLTNSGTSRCTTDQTNSQGQLVIPYYGGTPIKQQPITWNNRQTAMFMPYGLAGILLNNTTLKTEAKRFFTEFIRFGTYADGMTNDSSKMGESNSPVRIKILCMVLPAMAHSPRSQTLLPELAIPVSTNTQRVSETAAQPGVAKTCC